MLYKDFGTLTQSGNSFTFKHNADNTRTKDNFTYTLVHKIRKHTRSNSAKVYIKIEEPPKPEPKPVEPEPKPKTPELTVPQTVDDEYYDVPKYCKDKYLWVKENDIFPKGEYDYSWKIKILVPPNHGVAVVSQGGKGNAIIYTNTEKTHYDVFSYRLEKDGVKTIYSLIKIHFKKE